MINTKYLIFVGSKFQNNFENLKFKIFINIIEIEH